MPLFTWGNKKLPKTTAIFNMTSATACPANLLNLCQLAEPDKYCYARKAERMYKNALAHRLRQMDFWSTCSPCSFVTALMEEKKRKHIRKLRFNEAGDFISQNSVVKAETIAKLLYKGYGVETYCYTARSDLDFKSRKFLIINGSGFMIDNNFTIVKRGQSVGKHVCPQNCRLCTWCSERKKRIIYVEMH